MTTHNVYPSYVKHVLGSIYVFVFVGIVCGGGGGLPTEWYTTCLHNFSPSAAQKPKFSKLIFFDIVTTHKDHPSYVKHVLGSISVFFYGCRVCVWGGGFSKGLVHNLLMQFFILGSSTIGISETYFLIL